MRHRVDEIGFTSPSGLADQTRYGFRSRSPREQLEVEFEAPPGGATPAGRARDEVRQQLIDGLGSAVTIVGEGDRVVLGQPAAVLHYAFEDRGKPSQGYVVIANLGSEAHEGDFVQLAFQLEGDASRVPGVVDPVLASLARDQAGPGATWRQVGPFALELPARFAGPRSYVWADDELEQRLTITVHPFDAPAPELDAALDQLARARTIVARDDVPIIYGQLVRARLDDAGVPYFACVAVQAYAIGNPVRERWVEVRAEGRGADEAQVRKRVDDLLASIAVETRP